MAARLYFAAATAPRYDVYLIDELLAVGDEHFQAKCHERIRRMLGDGASGVLVTHDWSAVIRLCAEAHVLERGRLAFTGAADAAVVRYLGVEHPRSEVGRFADVDRTYGAETGADTAIVFKVDVEMPVALEVSFSIEALRIGVGWEIVILGDWTPVADQPGRYQVRLRIPALPLSPGSYSLNLFLRDTQARLHDIRSWTVGDGLTLTVTGEAHTAPRLPFRAVGPAPDVS
jgi:lipopolysaccharide transport system ATP-binding protein